MEAAEPAVPRPGDQIAEIAVVCAANICRSPLAAAMLEAEARRRLGPGAAVWVSSCGLHALVDQAASAGSAEEARRRGLDLGHHRAALAAPRDLGRRDLVLTMTQAQRDAIAGLVPGLRPRVFTIRELARLADDVPAPLEDGARERLRACVAAAHRIRTVTAPPPEPEDVLDPYGGPRAGYDHLAADLDALVGVLAALLFGGSAPRSATHPR